MADINLDQKENSYQNENSSVEVRKEICQGFDSFEKVTYKISYKKEYPSPSSWYWYWKPFYLHIRFKTTRNPFTYYSKEKNHVVKEVEVYYSKNHPDIPLIIGFKRDDINEFRYYTFLFLKNKSSHTGLPPTEYFSSDQLWEKLKQENNKRNKIKFVTRKSVSGNYDEKKDDSTFNDYTKFTYTPKDDEIYGNYELSSDSLFKKDPKIYIDSLFFDKLNDQRFDCIRVYYIKTSNIALLVEFISDSNKIYFVRKDTNGTYWSEKIINHEESSRLETQLQTLKSEFENCITFQLDKKANDQFYKSEYIKAFSYYNSGFTVVSHTPSRHPNINSSFVLYKKSLLELDKTQISGSKLDDIHKKTYHTINVHYYNLTVDGKNVDTNVPFFLDLKEKSTNTNYYLLRVDREGVKWREVDKADVNLTDPLKKKLMLQHIDYYSNTSIMVIINYKGIDIQQYILHSVENLFDLEGKIFKSSSANIIINQRGTLSGSTYKYCEHQFSHPFTLKSENNGLYSIVGLRLYISDATNGSIDHNNSIEIKTYNSNGNVREILYNESNGTKTNLYVYFRGQTNIPLLVQHDDAFYKPYSREQYFEKWIRVDDLKGSKPEDSNTRENIKNKLNEINKNLNEIDISKTDLGGYGIKNKGEPQQGKEYHELMNKTFSGKRVDVQQENQKYKKVIHSTVDKARMGEIKYGDTQIQNDSNQNLSTVVTTDQYNTLVVYYHIRDSGYTTPLLIKIGSSTSTSGLFYQRIAKESNINWKKVGDTSKLQSDGSDLESKINTIHYNFNNSVKIQLEQHKNINYSIKLVKNSDSSDIKADGDYGNVHVVEDLVLSPGSKYTSYKHTITFRGSNEPSDIGGIRLYIYDNELLTHECNDGDKCPIYYDPSIKDVYVYFCGSNKVPLLVCYNNKYYMPSSRDQYLKKWTLKTNITDKSQLQSNLDEINKILNQIDISETEHNTSYGIPKLNEEIRDLNEEFYNRVSVNRCKSKHFRMVTHTTTNGFIGTVMYGLKSTNISLASTNHMTNKLCLYYDSEDGYFTKPLLIKICSNIDTDVCHWYSRTGKDISNWKNETEIDKYDSDIKLEKQIKLVGELFVRLLVQIDKQGVEYDITATKGNGLTYNYSAKINLNIMTSRDSIKVDDYRFYYHSLSNYYKDNKQSLITKFGLSDKSDLELEIVIQIFNKIITLVESNGKPLNPPLTFTNLDHEQSRLLFVYFYEKDSLINNKTDKIPLLINYKSSFYAPFSKDSYFEKWKKVFELSHLESNTLLGSQGLTNELHLRNHDSEQLRKDNLKRELDKINQMLNEVCTSKQEDYGLQFCGNPFYNKQGGPNSKRIIVKKHTNNNYVMYVHTTSNGYEIGSINIGSSKLDDHKKDQKDNTIDELAVIFENSDLSSPKVLLVNEKSEYSNDSTTHGYYYKSETSRPFQYKYTKLNYGCHLMDKLKQGNSDYQNECDHDFAEVKNMLDNIFKSRMVSADSKQEVYYTDCKKDYESESRIDECPETKIQKVPLESGGTQEVQQIPVVTSDNQASGPYSVGQSHAQEPSVTEISQTTHVGSPIGPPAEVSPGGLTTKVEESEDDSQKSGEASDPEDTSRLPDIPREGDLNNDLSEDGPSSINEERSTQSRDSLPDQRQKTREEKPVMEETINRVTEGRGDSVSHVDSGSSNRSEGTGSNSITGDEKSDSNSGGNTVTEFIKENPGAVYGGGGTFVTAAGGAYPLYKLIGRFIG